MSLTPPPVADLPRVHAFAPVPPQPVTPPPTHPLRHRVLALSLLLGVVAPVLLSAVYLYGIAASQYHSVSAFSIRAEEYRNPLEALGAFAQIGTSSAADTSILEGYIGSQALVERIDAGIGLDAVFNLVPRDIVFSLGTGVTIEDKLDYWRRMVHVGVDRQSGLIELEVLAFTPEDARRINAAIIDAGSELVDTLSRIAQEDTTRYARADVAEAEEQLRERRHLLRQFREETSIIDPKADAERQSGVLGQLESQLAAALIEKETLDQTAQPGDPRLDTLDRRLRAIRQQIAQERASITAVSREHGPLPGQLDRYQELLLDLEFAQTHYTGALAAYETARSEARRQSRYVAVHIPPTLAEDSLYPRQEIILLLIAVGAVAFWSVGALLYYNIRERG